MTFSKLQILLACLVIALGLPAISHLVKHNQRQKQCAAYLQTLRNLVPVITQAQDAHQAQQQLLLEAWQQESPFGGRYEWISPWPKNPEALGALRLTGFPPSSTPAFSTDEFICIQTLWNVNPIPKARLASGFNGWPVCIIEAK